MMRSTKIETLLSIWIKGIGLDHRDALETHSKFFEEIVYVIREDLNKI
jgi:hypothetical protein